MTANNLPPPIARSLRPANYWHLVWQSFSARRGAMLGLWLVGFLFLVAFLAPAIAGRHPFYWQQDGELSFPFFRQFFAPTEAPERTLETVYNYLLLFIPLGGAILYFLRHQSSRFRQAIICGLALMVLLPFLLTEKKLDPTPYRRLIAEGKGSGIMPLIPYGPFEQGFGNRIAPTWHNNPDKVKTWHPLGTDNAGRDVLVRIIHGARVSLSVGIISVLIATVMGLVIGSLMGYFGGGVDMLLSRLTEVVICFPRIFLILILISIMDERSILNIIVIIGITGWTGIARLVRGEVLKQRSLDYVAAAQALGARSGRIIFRHVLPNSLAPVLVSMTFMIASSILMESSLSFLGFGVDIPTASWGELLNQAREAPTVYWWLVLFPGVPIFFTVTIYNLVGEGLRDAMDPRLRRE